MKNSEMIQVLVVDDHQLIIDGLKSLLQDEADIVFAGGANNLDQAVEFIKANKVNVVLVDINMPGGSGILTTRKIKEINPAVQLIALTMHEDFAMIRQMIDSGASGYILKRTNMNEVLEAIRVVAAGGKYLGRDVQNILFNNLGETYQGQEQKDMSDILSVREKEILGLIAREMSNAEIAEKLFISERTVETHRRNIFTKTNTKSIVGLIKFALKHQLISPESDTEN
ncbi:MAG: response regulator transcription factor [Bacteroidales bacterium]|jgi:DNA-binding NarL/FixJ family response regulator|nr:response regulator transcription factor [Bacteroidales bacterium]MCK9449636.1 response regulator transcription factor [Bacteroidales bacterium]MDD3701345.1 response regulator transcription factor [Bacteroidales bacterium]MDY0370511.1 response regulator transcription factor [Bacteroidales bacterium]